VAVGPVRLQDLIEIGVVFVKMQGLGHRSPVSEIRRGIAGQSPRLNKLVDSFRDSEISSGISEDQKVAGASSSFFMVSDDLQKQDRKMLIDALQRHGLRPLKKATLPLGPYFDAEGLRDMREELPAEFALVQGEEGDLETWLEARIVEWDPEKMKFCAQIKETGEEALLPRYRIFFSKSEPADEFAATVAQTWRRRANAELLLRYNLIVECMPKNEAIKLTQAQLERIVSYSSSFTGYKEAYVASRRSSLLEEVEDIFRRTMNKINFDLRVEKSSSRALAQDGLEQLPSLLNSLSRKLTPQFGCFQTGSYEIDVGRQFMIEQAFVAANSSLEALDAVHEHCQKIGDNSLFSLFAMNETIKETVSIDQFMKIQLDKMSSTINRIKEDWTGAITKAVRSKLQKDSERWILDTKSRDAYAEGEVRKFLVAVNLRMTDALRESIRKSISVFTDFLCGFTRYTLEIRSSNDVAVRFDDGMRSKRPLFALRLVAKDKVEDSAKPKDQSEVDEEEDEEDGPTETGSGGQIVFGFSHSMKAFFEEPVSILPRVVELLGDVTQVQRLLMDRIYWGEVPKIEVATEDLFNFAESEQHKTNLALKGCLKDLNAYLKSLKEFLPILRLDVDEFMCKLEEPFKKYEAQQQLRKQKNLQDQQQMTVEEPEEKETEQDDFGEDEEEDLELPPLDIDMISSEIVSHGKEKTKLEEKMLERLNLGLFEIDCSEMKKILVDKHKRMQELLLRFVGTRSVNVCVELLSKFTTMDRELSKLPNNIEELVAIRDFVHTIPNLLEELEQEIAALWKGFNLLDEYQFKLAESAFEKKWQLFGSPKAILDKIGHTLNFLEKEKLRFAEFQKEKQEEFVEQLEILRKQVDDFKQHSGLEEVSKIAEAAKSLGDRIRDAQAEAELFNSRETLFELEITDYESVQEISRDFQPYESMWEAAKEWLENEELWMNGPFNVLEPDIVDKNVAECLKQMNRSIKFFQKAELEGIEATAAKIKDRVESFRPFVPMISALRNPGMRDRHFEALSAELGMEVRAGSGFTLKKAIDMRLHQYSEKISNFSGIAGKEFQIEQTLDKMDREWKDFVLDCRPYKATGTFVLGGVDEVVAILDEHITMIQAMQFSTFKGPFIDRIDNFDKKLLLTSEVLEEWIAVQRNWLYLQPIFESPDINKQLPAEGKRFTSVDKNWRTTLLQSSRNVRVLDFCPNQKLLEMFSESNKLLDLVSKGLSDYLETKRSGFSRFYFLSNDELLEILSETKDPAMVQPHLKKCFEGIRSVFFDDDMCITEMKSSEGEVVPFHKSVKTDGKNVEVWMTELEENMKVSMKEVMWRSMLTYVEMERTKWLQVVPGQCALNGSQFHWTREIEGALDNDGNEGIGKCFEQQAQQINDMVALVRDPELKSNARMTISALTVIDVHARDVTEKLFKEGVSDKSEFLWISQLRYYWTDGDALDGEMRVMMVSSLRPYGYEYLGNSFRLVITPLTDKCYLTLMGALQMNLGGAPAGPAGTGKTETTKDLAKALAKQCVVFNCSDGLDYLAMGKFFKGLGSCGAWACFDEFNRIDVEVLSVVAQQIMTLQAGVRAGSERIQFEGSEIKLSDQFAVFITMNPGYAGRTELPDNLKALFRPVAMMVPDYALIGEIMLYSFGYEKARICAQKMVATFRLSSEQLSSQPHYDYGMRAVKTVIVAAGNLRRDNPNEDEEILLLRALQDVNLPKFLSNDLPLFKGIMSDLFPGMNRPHIDYGELLKCLRIANEDSGLQNVPWFLTKQIQLYETIVVRHGLMLVGPTGGGKSCNVENLDAALSMLKRRGVKGFAFEKVQRSTVNPKSITMGQLYGEFDQNTHEWQDGILANIVRNCAKSATPDRKWVIFDGPVDAIWIENMNTVLDDNKKLCLNSGEIVGLSPEMTMMFEVEDLEVASPATVSRVGVVYMEPNALGLDPVRRSWLETLPEPLRGNSNVLTKLQTLFDFYVKSLIWFLRRNFKEPVPTCDNALNASLLKMLDCHIGQFRASGDETDKCPEEVERFFEQDLEALFIFCAVWSICCTVDREGRMKFDRYLRNLMETNKSKCCFPEIDGLTVYDFCWTIPYKAQEGGGDLPKSRWTLWPDTVASFSCSADLSFHETIVPTKDSICYTHLLEKMLKNRKPLLMTGPTGTGKTVNIGNYIKSGMPSDFVPLPLTFSAQTSANQTQDLIDSKCEKRRKGVFGPPAGKHFIVFIDDLNMPKREKYFAQPPIEIVRQWFTYGGWYDRKTLTFRKLIDLTMVAAMGPPGGGRNPVTARLIRHYTVVNYTVMDESAMQGIYETMLNAFLTSHQFDRNFFDLGKQLVSSTIEIFETICRELLPTPARSHYTYNLRDVGKVFQGLLMVNPKKIESTTYLVRAWAHESRRVFSDRLINAEDRGWFDKQLAEHISTKMKTKVEDIFSTEAIENSDPLIFCDFLVQGESSYEQVTDVDNLLPLVKEYLNDHNSESKQPMKLVLFMDAIIHVCRIARVLRQPLGNVLLLGVGGSGRQSLTKLASFIADAFPFHVEITEGYGMPEWREDIKRALLKAGIEDHQVAFLFVDTQIINEQMLEDINSILNSGDVPNLYGPEDMESIMTACKSDCMTKRIPPTKINIFSQYLLRVKRNMHMCMCMSPGTAIFRDRLRMFPSLVNCCAIDWFSEWPEEALKSVGMGVMQEIDLKLDHHLEHIVELFKIFHQSVAEASIGYYETLRRYNYVTPASYLELLTTYRILLQKKRVEVGGFVDRLQTGLNKLLSTSDMVADLQKELTEMQPVLVKTQGEVEAMIKQIAVDKESTKETMAAVAVEEAEAEKKAARTKEIADDAQKDLDEALPALDEAVECLNKLKKSDLDEVKSLKTPPKGVKLTMEAACIMFGIKPVMVTDPNKMGAKIKDYWAAAQKSLLQNANQLLQDLMTFEKDEISEKTIELINPYVEMPEFTPKEIEKASKACTAICMWVRAMHKYHNVAKAVEPKKKLLAEAQAELDATMDSLNGARARLKAVQEKIAELESEFEKSNAKKLQLENEVEECAARLERAHKLIGGLGGERDRWTESVAQLQTDYANLVGDVLISSGSVAYLGPFTSTYRESLNKEWLREMGRLNIPHTANVDIVQTLGDPVTIRAWNIEGLPSDTHSIQNGIVINEARRWPLLIDPQTQANRYLKNMGKIVTNAPNGIEVIKQGGKNLLRSLENGIRFGKWVLLETVGEKLDAALEPVLQQQTFMQGSQLMIKLGDSTVPYHESFRFFMTTKLPNPHYPPEVAVKVSLLNFSITPQGLEDQLLGILMVNELPEKEERKNELVVDNARMAKELKDIEDTILGMLSNSEGNILDDEELIETLATSKVTSDEINEKVEEAKVTEAELDAERESYRPVAFRGSLLFFTISDLRLIDPMYEYSLQMFTGLFRNAILNSSHPDDPSDIQARIDILNEFFTFSLYQNICRSLFEKDKLLFSFSLVIKVLQGDGKIDPFAWRFLLSGQAPSKIRNCEVKNESPGGWIGASIWSEAVALEEGMASFEGFASNLMKNSEEWKRIFDSEMVHREELPCGYAEKLSMLEKLCVLRCIRPDKIVEGVQDFVTAHFGQRFIESPPFEIEACFRDSYAVTPLIFVLTSGSDPTKDFMAFAESYGRKVSAISLGQGQGPLAESLIRQGILRGSWILLQNCHLASSWMPTLEQICESLDPAEVHEDFRLWLTSMPSETFPVSVLQNGIKLTKEPPKGLRANLKQVYFNLDDDELSTTNKPEVFRKLLFGLCFFHALVQERRKFGPLGWNIPYEFNDTDLEISRAQLELYLNKYDEIPYKVIHVLTSVMNYGGRVTDAIDSRTIDVILRKFYTPEVLLSTGYSFSESGIYRSIEVEENFQEEYLKYIDGLPVNAEPEVFGLHENANISCALQETNNLFETLMILQPRSSGVSGAPSREEIVTRIAEKILSMFPEQDFDIEAIMMAYPTRYEESMNTVLVQEVTRYQRLLKVVRDSLPALIKALAGLVVLSSELEQMADSIFGHKVPSTWEAVAYPSLKPLMPWVDDFCERIAFLRNWVENGTPNAFWISGFFFPQAFLTGTRQNFSRKLQISIDTTSFRQLYLSQEIEQISEGPEDGAYVHGLFLEGARWNNEEGRLATSEPKVLFTPMPVIHFVPVQFGQPLTQDVYRAPVYKVLSRRGVLSTTGHSSNHVMWISIPTDHKPQFEITNVRGESDRADFIRAGVACFCSLKF